MEIKHRNQGVGQALMKHAFQKAIDLGYTAAFLVGNPAYYQRFGYRQTDEFGIVNQSEIPDQFVLACELIPDALKYQWKTLIYIKKTTLTLRVVLCCFYLPSALNYSKIFKELLVPIRVAPASIIALQVSQSRIPPAALT